MHHGRRIHGAPLTLRGTETNSACGRDGGLVQSVAQTAHYTHDARFARGREQDFNQDFTFDLKAARLLCISWARLGKNLDRGETR
jgi:hypothetical protein